MLDRDREMQMLDALANEDGFGVVLEPPPLVTVAIKDGERYVFIYSPNRVADVLRTLSKFACHPELNFDWYTAAMVSQSVRAKA